MKRLILIALAPLLLPAAADAKCKLAPRSPLCQPGQANCEPRCITTSDGGPGRDNMYLDGRKHPQAFSTEQRRRMAMRRAMASRTAKQAEGRAQWANDGTPSSVGTISPFVPGSIQDKAWREERARRGR